jgi:mannose-6-phosphate isomerase-like protein (cupin superfamily)
MSPREPYMSTEEAVRSDPKAEVFSLSGTPVLSQGRYDTVLARCDGFGARVKVYFEGGENATHTHMKEDHLFFVLAGQATFHLNRNADEVVVANEYEGVFLPRGAYYRFQSSGEENLVMLRVGAWSAEDRERTGADGLPLLGRDPRNNHVDGIPIPGRFFKE